MCTGMSVYRHVGINLSALYGVFSLCLNLVPQKEKVQFWLPRSQSGWGGYVLCGGTLFRVGKQVCRKDS